MGTDIMAEALGWDEARALQEHKRAEEVLARDFAGPVPNKKGATLRTACTADVKDVFDKIDVRKRGVLSKDGIGKASVELGFPLNPSELHQAMSEMDTTGNGEVNFPEFLAWWNSSKKSQALQTKFYLGVRGEAKWSTTVE